MIRLSLVIARAKSIPNPVIVAIIIVLATSVFFWLRSERSITKYYADRLELLEKTLQELPPSFEISEDIETDLSRYDQKLTSGLSLCQEMNKRKKALSGETLAGDLQKLIDDTDRLCTDLSAVMSYSRALYSTLGPYLTLPTTNWSTAHDKQLGPLLKSTQSTMNHTLSGLQKANSTAVQDPGLLELTSQVELASKYAAEAQSALDRQDTAAARQATNRLIEEIAQDKKEFLNSRHYFWYNTVQLDALLESVRGLQQQFEDKS